MSLTDRALKALRSVIGREREEKEQSESPSTLADMANPQQNFFTESKYGQLNGLLAISNRLLDRYVDYECLTGDMQIVTLKGPRTILSLVKEYEANPSLKIPLYTWNGDRITVGYGEYPRFIKKAKVFRLMLDNGAVIRATADHRFMMRDGSYKTLSELAVGDSLMPLYLSKDFYGNLCYSENGNYHKGGLTRADQYRKRKVIRMVAEHKLQRRLDKGEIVRNLLPDKNCFDPDALDISFEQGKTERVMYPKVIKALLEAKALCDANCVAQGQKIYTIENSIVVPISIETYILSRSTASVIGFDLKTKAIKAVDVSASQMTHRDAEILKANLDNGQTLSLTPDHRCLLVDQTFKPFGELKKGDQLVGLGSGIDLSGAFMLTHPSYTTVTLLETPVSSGRSRVFDLKTTTETFLVSGAIVHNCALDFPPIEEFDWSHLEEDAPHNHSVALIEELGEEDVYCLEVPGTHNYVVGDENGGVFTHNCFDGDTKVFDQHRLVRLGDKVGEEIQVTCIDGVQRPGVVKSFGIKPVQKITLKPLRSGRTSYRREVIATENHRWYLDDGSVTNELQVGDVLHEATMRSVSDHDDHGFAHGFIFGDGERCTDKDNRFQLRLSGAKSSYLTRLAPFSHSVTYPESYDGDPMCYFDSEVDYKSVPDEKLHSAEYIASFIAGWLAADACHHKGRGDIRLLSTINHDAGKWLCDRAPFYGYAVTWCQYPEMHRSFENSKPLMVVTLRPNQSVAFKVESIEKLDEREVFCLRESVTSTLTLGGGILTGNCMDEYPDINTANHYFASNATQPNIDNDRTVWVDSKDHVIKGVANTLLRKKLHLDDELFSIAYSLVKYGNNFEEVLVTNNGVVGLNYLPPATVRRVEHSNGALVGFIQDPRGEFSENMADLRAMILGEKEMSQGVALFEDWQLLHMRLRATSRRSPYGYAIADGARWIWKRLVMLEDSTLVYKLTRAPSRFAFYVDVTDQPAKNIPNIMKQVKANFKKRQIVDPRTGQLSLQMNPLASDEDFFIPVRDGRDIARIENLQGPEYTSMEPVEYFQRKLHAVLKVPREYLGQDGAVPSRSILSNDDERAARTTLNIQKELRSHIKTLIQIDAAARSVNDPWNLDFDVRMTMPSGIYALAQYETKNSLADFASRIEPYVSKDWIRRVIFKLSDEEINAIEKGAEKDMQMSFGSQMPSDFGGIPEENIDLFRKVLEERVSEKDRGIIPTKAELKKRIDKIRKDEDRKERESDRRHHELLEKINYLTSTNAKFARALSNKMEFVNLVKQNGLISKPHGVDFVPPGKNVDPSSRKPNRG